MTNINYIITYLIISVPVIVITVSISYFILQIIPSFKIFLEKRGQIGDKIIVVNPQSSQQPVANDFSGLAEIIAKITSGQKVDAPAGLSDKEQEEKFEEMKHRVFIAPDKKTSTTNFESLGQETTKKDNINKTVKLLKKDK